MYTYSIEIGFGTTEKRTDGGTDRQKIWGALGARANAITINKSETEVSNENKGDSTKGFAKLVLDLLDLKMDVVKKPTANKTLLIDEKDRQIPQLVLKDTQCGGGQSIPS